MNLLRLLRVRRWRRSLADAQHYLRLVQRLDEAGVCPEGQCLVLPWTREKTIEYNVARQERAILHLEELTGETPRVDRARITTRDQTYLPGLVLLAGGCSGPPLECPHTA